MKGNNPKKLLVTYILLGVIILLLILIITYLFGYLAGQNSSTARPIPPTIEPIPIPDTTPEPEDNQNNNQKDKNPSIPLIPLTPSTEKETNTDPSEPIIPSKKKLYLVLDDCGGSLTQLQPFLDLPIEITYAIIPFLQHSTQAAELIHQRGREIILHQPMEPEGNANPGEGSIFTTMKKDAIINQLQDSFISVPHAIGMNNHMGSKATADTEVMTAVLSFLRGQQMFFLDSKTTPKVVGQPIAVAQNVKYLQRNAMFLDNEKDKDSIELAVRRGLKTANKNGHAVMIGHVMTSELAEVLLTLYPEILDEGYEFDRLSDYFTGDEEE